MYKTNTVKADLILELSKRKGWYTIGQIMDMGFSYKVPSRISELGACIESRYSDKKNRQGVHLKEYRFSPDYEAIVEIRDDNTSFVLTRRKSLLKKLFS